MDHVRGETVVAGLCIGMWIVVTAVCLSRTPFLLEDRHHPLASPLVTVKVTILILLAFWALCYAGLGEFDLLFSDAPWRIVPACIFHLMAVQFLRPMAVILFCIVISTPATSSQGLVRVNSKQAVSSHNRRSDRVATMQVDAERKFHAPYLHREELGDVDYRNAYSEAEEDDSGGHMPEKSSVGRGFANTTNSFSLSILNPIKLDLDYGIKNTTPSTNCNSIRLSQRSPTIQKLGALNNFVKADSLRPSPGDWEPCKMQCQLDGYLQGESSGSENVKHEPVPLRRAPDENEGQGVQIGLDSGNIYFDCKQRCYRVAVYIGYWLVGILPPGNRVGSEGNAMEVWSRLLLWRVALRFRSILPVWFFSVSLSCVFVSFLLTEEVRGCLERTSETAVCRTPGMDSVSPPRLYLPRSISIIELVDNALLLVLWVVCGLECLSHIGNLITKQRFVRTYIVGVLLFVLHTIYDSVELFDELRYNGLVAVVLISLRNVCDAVLVMLLALRLGSGNKQMPRWYSFLASWWQGASGNLSENMQGK
ncbi:hypothetical protein TcG_05670 [Trypanosoma cruzi]|nr:hypothetical protein TcG_05670 [Trypanosoma cruzi]